MKKSYEAEQIIGAEVIVGRQVPITLEGEDYFIDMLFFEILNQR